MKKIIVCGGDGFCGWPTALRLAAAGHTILIIDNLSRRDIDEKLKTSSLTTIASIEDRIKVANQKIGKIEFKKIDLANDYLELKDTVRQFAPNAIVHFAEQRSAPYSMISEETRRYTVDNNISGTHNICNAILEVNPEIHLVHLGTMGVYGYNKDFGSIPEGYLQVKIPQTNKDAEILYPANPGSVYHMTKCLDQILFQFYNKNWGMKITDLHQGIVWGIDTGETKEAPELTNRFDYDGVYGTVLNRFLVQAANGYPLTVYGTGGQTRAFIHISDTAECIRLSIENDNFDRRKVRIFNQVSETRSVKELAELVAQLFKVSYENLENPRKELANNDLEVSNEGLQSLGFKPIILNEGLIDDVFRVAKMTEKRFDASKVLNSPKW